MESGQRLGGYTLQGILGRGAMGEVWLAEREGGQRVALKMMLGAAHAESDAAKRFAREIELLGGLDHPGIVKALGPLEREGEALFYAMEPILGRTLHALLRAGGPLEPAQAVSLTCELLDALEAAHQAGVIHRDVKPSNVLVDREGRARLTDFGLALAMDHTRLTAAETILGTLAYMSPEQAKGQQATAQSDLYAVGAVLFELIAGRAPFVSETPSGLLMQHLSASPPDLGSLVSGLTPGLADLVARALSKQPLARFASAAAFRDALRALGGESAPEGLEASTVELRSRVACLESEPDLGVQTTQVAAPPPPARRGGLLAPLAVAGVLIAGLIALRPWERQPPPTTTPPPSATPTQPVVVAPSPAQELGPRVVVELTDGSQVEGWLQTYDGQYGILTLFTYPDRAVRSVDRFELRKITHVQAVEEGDTRGDSPR